MQFKSYFLKRNRKWELPHTNSSRSALINKEVRACWLNEKYYVYKTVSHFIQFAFVYRFKSTFLMVSEFLEEKSLATNILQINSQRKKGDMVISFNRGKFIFHFKVECRLCSMLELNLRKSALLGLEGTIWVFEKFEFIYIWYHVFSTQYNPV